MQYTGKKWINFDLALNYVYMKNEVEILEKNLGFYKIKKRRSNQILVYDFSYLTLI